MINISIVIYNNPISQIKKVLQSCLSSQSVSKIFLVDNSKNKALKALENSDGRIVYIHTGSNLGYGKAHNIAITKSVQEGVEYHLVLNPDVYFDSGVLEELHDYMRAHKEIANIMPKILYPNGAVQHLVKLLPTPADLLLRRFLPSGSLKQELQKRYELRESGYNSIIETPNLSGCFMFMRTEALEEVGAFDERFFMYMEDIDLGRRLAQKYRTVFYPKVSVFHDYAKGSYKSMKLLGHHVMSAVRYFNKWGWLWDEERTIVNAKILKEIKGKE